MITFQDKNLIDSSRVLASVVLLIGISKSWDYIVILLLLLVAISAS